MPTEAEIIANYNAAHDALSDSYYSSTSGLTKEEFDLQHGKIWSDMTAELIAAGYLPEPTEPRNLDVEIDSLRERVEKLEKKDKIE